MSQLANLRQFVERHLTGFATWADHVTPIGQDSRDRASIQVLGRYRITCLSSHQEPPLGRVDFDDMQGQAHFSGPIAELTWMEIAKQIKGISPALPLVPVVVPPKPVLASEFTVAPDDRKPHLGMPVLFIPQLGEHVANMYELAALVTRVESPTMLSLMILAPSSEVVHRERIPRRVREGQRNCWDFATPASDADQLLGMAADLDGRVAALEAKRGPGRPAKAQDGEVAA